MASAAAEADPNPRRRKRGSSRPGCSGAGRCSRRSSRARAPDDAAARREARPGAAPRRCHRGPSRAWPGRAQARRNRADCPPQRCAASARAAPLQPRRRDGAAPPRRLAARAPPRWPRGRDTPASARRTASAQRGSRRVRLRRTCPRTGPCADPAEGAVAGPEPHVPGSFLRVEPASAGADNACHGQTHCLALRRRRNDGRRVGSRAVGRQRVGSRLARARVPRRCRRSLVRYEADRLARA